MVEVEVFTRLCRSYGSEAAALPVCTGGGVSEENQGRPKIVRNRRSTRSCLLVRGRTRWGMV